MRNIQEIPSKKRKAKKERECFRIYIIYRNPSPRRYSP